MDKQFHKTTQKNLVQLKRHDACFMMGCLNLNDGIHFVLHKSRNHGFDAQYIMHEASGIMHNAKIT